ncbi:extracellular solute-binding protein [Arenimonas caeni]|jgi:putrescine transport system substrate-binding protein|uniref:Putrescine-binding periplasmic protein n=1 Tax=Arenimonas caeni TaxID=2058085 RepID=A0A2P6M856_9GAMM|nr:extracellular solute-binding protein [Arenimonas caeni]MDY0020903.1 extracellular solute-binding protein [Arenimonas caeni]PRH82166.1 spermidine/putrescine ABC transporter substrate-binding protein PotF [Arenimonas caeni]
MKARMSAICLAFVLAGCGGEQPASQGDAGTAAPPAGSKVLNIYNWSDYIGEDTIANFEAETGIKVTYDVFDSNELLEAKLMSGNTGYDIVVPSLTFLSRQVQAGVFQELDKSRFTNYGNLDPDFLALLAQNDPGNAHSLPYLWGTTGIGYNVEKVKAALGEDAPVDSWALVFEPENLAKLKGCGVAFLDTPSEIIPPVLRYLGEEPNSFDEAVVKKAVDRLQELRPHITYFHSSQFINDLANGDICVAVGWSGDIIQAQARAAEAAEANPGKPAVEVAYSIPKEGAPMWFDMLAIPKDAKNVDNAYLFLDYVMRADVTAGIQNYVMYASANQAALPLVDEAVLNDPGIYPDEETKAKLFTLAVLPPEVDRMFTRHWTTLKTGQ